MLAIPRPSDPLEGLVGDQHAMVRAHGHFPAEDFLVVFAAHCGHRDVSTDFGDNLQGFFDGMSLGSLTE